MLVLRFGEVREARFETVAEAVIRHEAFAGCGSHETRIASLHESRFADEGVPHQDSTLPKPTQVTCENLPDLNPCH
eukprot:3933755-Rhodomonas_salina.1